MGYSIYMNTIRRTREFDKWLKSLNDGVGRAAILSRLNRVRAGNFGDAKPVGEGVFEMRVNFGPGYRVYYFQRGSTLYVVAYGGDKSTQQSDIVRAKEIAREYTD